MILIIQKIIGEITSYSLVILLNFTATYPGHKITMYVVQVVLFQKYSITSYNPHHIAIGNPKNDIVIVQRFYILLFCAWHLQGSDKTKTIKLKFLNNHDIIFWFKW